MHINTIIITMKFVVVCALQWGHKELKSPASRVFTQLFVQAQIKEDVKASYHLHLWGEFTCRWWIPHKKSQ